MNTATPTGSADPLAIAPRDVDQVADAVRSTEARLVPRGAGTKERLTSVLHGARALDLRGLRGIVEYDPSEFTFTARAGTPLAEIVATLDEHGQFLPFDPPWVDAGATLGGALSSGIAGSGRQRYGGARDFVIGVTLIDGAGNRIQGGGKVVKNAAGFDLPKLVVGALGTLGVLVDATLKVFPRPSAYRTACFELDGFEQAHRQVARLAGAPFDLDALDLVPGSGSSRTPRWRILVRVGGAPDSLAQRLSRIAAFLGLDAESVDDEAQWQNARELGWAPASDHTLLRVPLAPRSAAALETELAALDEAGASAPRRYVAGCSALWLAWPIGRSLASLESLLARSGLVGLALRGALPDGATGPLLGELPGAGFYRRLTTALDPRCRFPYLRELRLATAPLRRER